jgi:Type II secretion system protein C
MSQDDRHSSSIPDTQDPDTQDTVVQTAREADAPQLSPWESTFGPKVVTETGGFSVASYADRLMDDLFDDMETTLERGSTLSHEMVQPEPLVASSQQLQQRVLTALMQRRQSEVERVEADRSGVSDLVAAAVSPLSPPESSAQESSAQGATFFDRLLLGIGCVAITATGALWLMKHPWTVNAPPLVAQSSDPESTAFGEYMKQALQTIVAKAPLPSSSPSLPTSGTTVPSVSVPLGLSSPQASPSPTRVATGLSRLVPPAPLPRAQAVAPGAPPAPGFMASAPMPPASGTAALGAVHSLVGVMQLGDRSAALIEINGVAQRVRLGESISSSGWTLVEVSKDQAVIRRNGEVRSIFIGQNF